jgi:GxxExxY protein
MNENAIGSRVIESALTLHRELGPGLLESVYERILAELLVEAGLRVRRQVPIPIRFRDLVFDEGFRADLIVEDLVVLELKSTEAVTAVHRKQIQTYLRLANLRLGYLLNFGAALMKDGIVRVVNGLPE